MSVTLYILEFVLCSAVFVALYKLFIEGRVSYRYSRIYLVWSMVFSAVVRMLDLPLSPAQTIYYELPVITFERPVEIQPSADIVTPSEPTVEPVQQPIDWGMVAGVVAASIYGLIVMLNLARFAWRLWLIRKLRRRCELTIYEAYTLALSDHISEPFSFWRTVYMNRHMQGRERQHILTHELSHVSHHHTAERLTLELMRCVFWFNPFVWIAGSLLVQVQEWQADKDVIDAGYDVYEYRNFIFRQLYGVGPEVDLTSGLHSKLTKKRFLMMTDFKKGRFQLLRMVASVPVMAAMILAFGAVKAEDKIVYNSPSQISEPIAEGYETSGFVQAENSEVEQDTVKAKYPPTVKYTAGIVAPEDEKQIILNKGTYKVMGIVYTSAEYNKTPVDVVILVLNDSEMAIKNKSDWKFVESGTYSYVLTNKRLTIARDNKQFTFDTKYVGPTFKSSLKIFTPDDSKIRSLDFVGPMESRDSSVMIGFKDGKVYLNGKETTVKELDEVYHLDFEAPVNDPQNQKRNLYDILSEGMEKTIPQPAVEESEVASVKLSANATKAAELMAKQRRPIINIKHTSITDAHLYLEGIEITLPEFQKIMASGDMSQKTFVLGDPVVSVHTDIGQRVQEIVAQSGAKFELGRNIAVVDGNRAKMPSSLKMFDSKVHTVLNDEVKQILKSTGISEREFLEGCLIEFKSKSELSIVVCKHSILFNNRGSYNIKTLRKELSSLKAMGLNQPISLYVQNGTSEESVSQVKELLSSLDLLGSTTIKPTSTYGLKHMPAIFIDCKLSTEKELAELSPNDVGPFNIITEVDHYIKKVLANASYSEADFAKTKMLYVERKTQVMIKDGKLYLNGNEISLEEYVKLDNGSYSDAKTANMNKVYFLSQYFVESPRKMVHRIGPGGDPAKCRNLARSKLSEFSIIQQTLGYNVEVFEAVKNALMKNHRVKYIMIVDHECKGEIICKDIDGETVVFNSWDRKYSMRKPEYSVIKAEVLADDKLIVDGYQMNLAEFRRYISEYGRFTTKIRLITEPAKSMSKEQVMAVAERLRDELIMGNVVRDVKFVTRKGADAESDPIDLEECAEKNVIPIGYYVSYGYVPKDKPKPEELTEPEKLFTPERRRISQMIPFINIVDDNTLYVLNRTEGNIIKSGKYRYSYANGILTLKGEQEYSFPYYLSYKDIDNSLLINLQIDKVINDVEVEFISVIVSSSNKYYNR